MAAYLKGKAKIDAARSITAATGESYVDPEVLFERASRDDMEHYTAEMLARCAVYAATELTAWDGGAARITIETIPGVEPDDVAISVLSITDHTVPFLYDSAVAEVASSCGHIYLATHSALSISDAGQPVSHTQRTFNPARSVSHIQFHLAQLPATLAADLIKRLSAVVEQVHVIVSDWWLMLAKLDAVTAELARDEDRRTNERHEARAFLSWLRDDNFIFLGMREYRYSGEGAAAKFEKDEGTGLGILANRDILVVRHDTDTNPNAPEMLAFIQRPDILIISKASSKSVVHRRAQMDYVGIKRFDVDGRVIGELRIVGLFTSTAYRSSVSNIPYLRRKFDKVIDQFNFDSTSDFGQLQEALDSYPRDDLFQIDVPLLARFCEQIIDLTNRPRIRVLPRIDLFERFVSVIVYVPRDSYSSAVREKIGNYLENAYEGQISTYYPAFHQSSGVARVQFIVDRSGGKTPRCSQARLEETIRLIIQAHALEKSASPSSKYGDEDGNPLIKRIDSRTVFLLFATSRKEAGLDNSLQDYFSGERSSKLTFGWSAVRVPEEHRFGNVDLPRKWTLFSIPVSRQKHSSTLHFTVQHLTTCTKENWCDLIQETSAEDAFIFVHGYYTSFTDAMLKCAQITWDLKLKAVPILFSWPSRASFINYNYDRDSASGAKDEFIEVLSALKTRPNIKRIHILAHSMGNQIVLDALAHHAHTTHPLGVCEILMAAPDVDSDSYRKWAPKVKAAVTGMTLYASACDKAMMLSKAIAGNIPRAGDVPSDGPVLVPEIQAIDVTELGSEMLGLNHGLYAQKRSILNDIFVLLETGKRSPQDRLADIRGVPDGASDPRYWKYAKSA
ncbi:alpha/beta hydrolase [Sinorhizobium meliloti]|uniref:alpha/beta hydrolase n=2 Tax=Rhizobium meliloti TaxID=382 RepID=UPI000B49A08C|nr:alpha/beta hydrolase [Sinorhizobium meliloti]ASQ15060.1 hypothetical protein CDO22_34740 [Sinorhizobium meliloti]